MGSCSSGKSFTTFASILWFCGCIFFAKASPIVRIKNGTLEGTVTTSRQGKEFFAFKAIPFAQPPMGKLRFEPAKPSDAWSGIRSAKEDPNFCPQRNFFSADGDLMGDEDCLYLNVYSPKLPSSNDVDHTPKNYPVMIFIHGGGFMSGGCHSIFYGPKFLMDHEVVYVAMNYRLGALGFLSTQDDVSPGNQGLKDQTQALRWVHENIAAFGGDPNRVTIFGESAGGASVHYHILSPLSKGLFHRGISQSGNAFCPWALNRPREAKIEVDRLAKAMDCPTDSSQALVDCLRTKDPFDIITTDKPFKDFEAPSAIPFGPTIEHDHPGAFIIEEPALIIESGDYNDVPWLTGTNSHEGAIRVPVIYGQPEKGYVEMLDENFIEMGPRCFLYEATCPKEYQAEVTKRIREFYLGDKKVDESTRMNLVDLYTDAWFYIAADRTVRGHLEASSSPIFYYYFSYQGSVSFSEVFGDSGKDYGVAHCDELLYLFPIAELLFPGKQPTEQDEKMIDLLTSLWVNFAKTGNPTPERSPKIPIKWKSVKSSKREYLHIDGPKDLAMEADLHPERVKFWAGLPYLNNIKPQAKRTKDEF